MSVISPSRLVPVAACFSAPLGCSTGDLVGDRLAHLVRPHPGRAGTRRPARPTAQRGRASSEPNRCVCGQSSGDVSLAPAGCFGFGIGPHVVESQRGPAAAVPRHCRAGRRAGRDCRGSASAAASCAAGVAAFGAGHLDAQLSAGHVVLGRQRPGVSVAGACNPRHCRPQALAGTRTW